MQMDEKSSVRLTVALGRTFRDFLTHTSSHGLKYLGEDDRTRFERVFWIGAVSLGLATATFMVLNIYQRYTNTPTVMTLDVTHYPTWMIPFPAVTLCNLHPIVTSRADALINSLHLPAYMNRTGALLALMELAALNNPDEASTQVGQELQDLLKINHLRAHELMPQLAQPCSEMLEKCLWQNKLIDCNTIFKMEKSNLGYCCSFNYHLNSADMISEASFLYGDRTGLMILVKPVSDAQLLSSFLSTGLAVQIHDPFVYPDDHVIMKMVPLNTEVLLPVQATIKYGSEDLEAMSTSGRKCVYHYENKLKYFTRYLANNCLTECRMNYSLRHCGCIPYYYPSYDRHRVCDLEDVSCIYQNVDALHNFRPHPNNLDREIEDHVQHSKAALHATSAMTCPCPIPCEAVMMEARVSNAPLTQPAHSLSRLMDGSEINMTDRILIHVFMQSDTSYGIKRDERVSTSNLLGMLGGIASLFLGCSFVTPLEVVYFLVVRLPAFLDPDKDRGGGSCPASPRVVHPERIIRPQSRDIRFPSVRTQNLHASLRVPEEGY